jgi:Fe-S-cluster-containing dehydrogenase component
MKKWHLIIDVEKCEDCNNCLMACKDEHVGNEWPSVSKPQPRHGHYWMNIMRKERGQFPLIDVAYLPTLCMHCDNAPCVKASQGACSKRMDGIVIIDPAKAEGKKEIIKSCPYGAIWWNEEEELPQKCTLCAHLLDDGWKQPRCAQACPTGALRVAYVEDSELDGICQAEKLEVYKPEFGTQPQVYYKNLHRYTKCFIGGSVAVSQGGKIDCAQGARVILFKEKEKLAELVTDNFGDFKFDQLSEQSGKYLLEIGFVGYSLRTMEVDLGKSLNMGTILLE